MSQGCTMIAAPRSAAASKNGNSSGASRFQSLQCEPICTPLQAQLVDAALQLADGQLRRLQRHRADAGVVAADNRGKPQPCDRSDGDAVPTPGSPVPSTRTARARWKSPARLRRSGRSRRCGAAGSKDGFPHLAEELAVLVDAMPAIGMHHHRKARRCRIWRPGSASRGGRIWAWVSILSMRTVYRVRVSRAVIG